MDVKKTTQIGKYSIFIQLKEYLFKKNLLPKSVQKFNAIHIKTPKTFLIEINSTKVHMEP